MASERGLGDPNLIIAALAQLIVTLMSELKPTDQGDCLVQAECLNEEPNDFCPNLADFQQFRRGASNYNGSYVEYVVETALFSLNASKMSST